MSQDPKKPNFFIVGQAKSGTTALYEFLAQHPQVFLPTPKEPHYFCQDLHEESDRFHGKRRWFEFRTEADYLGLFRDPGEATALGEASVHYLYSQTAAKQIRDFDPNAKIIAIFREPVAFLYSLYYQKVDETQETAATFREAMELEPQRRNGKNTPNRVRFPSVLHYRKRVDYTNQLMRFLESFPGENVKTIIYDDFRADNAGVMRQVMEFLGVDADFTPDYKDVNQSKVPRFRTLNYILRSPAPRILAKKMIPTRIYEPLQLKVQSLLMKPEKKSSLDPELERELKREFKPEVECFGELMNRDLVTLWGYDSKSL